MAEVIFHRKYENHYEFRLSNKPEYLFLCDLEDFKYLFDGSWYVHVAKKCKYKTPYIRKSLWPSNRQIHFHRFVMSAGDYEKNNIVDHISRDTTDNRKSNLRFVTSSISVLNRRQWTYDGNGNPHTLILDGIVYAVHKRKDRNSYQCYQGQKYIGSSASHDALKEKIINYHNQSRGKNDEKPIEGIKD